MKIEISVWQDADPSPKAIVEADQMDAVSMEFPDFEAGMKFFFDLDELISALQAVRAHEMMGKERARFK